MTHCFSKNFVRSSLNALCLCISFPMILPLWPPNGSLLCSRFLDSEPLHFSSKSDDILHASLYHLSLKNKLTLDLSRYTKILKLCNLKQNSLKLGANDQMTHCL